jgi:hypothetical protein
MKRQTKRTGSSSAALLRAINPPPMRAMASAQSMSTTLGLQACREFRKLGFWLVARCDCVANLYQATSAGPLWVQGLTRS